MNFQRAVLIVNQRNTKTSFLRALGRERSQVHHDLVSKDPSTPITTNCWHSAMMSLAVESAQHALLSSSLSNPALIGAVWMISSSLFTTYTTTRFLKYPTTTIDAKSSQRSTLRNSSPLPPSNQLTILRFLGSFLLGVLVHPDLRILERMKATTDAMPDFFLPALFLFIANFTNSIALDRIGISLTYTSKCGIPMITVLLTILMDGTRALPNAIALASLLPIALGIAAASWNSPTFEWIGFCAAVISTTAQSALNVTSKRVLARTGATGLEAQRAMVATGFIITWLVNSVWTLRQNNGTVKKEQERPPWILAAAAVVAYHVEYVLSFLFVSLVAPVTYGASDAVRRLMIILTGRAMFGGHALTPLNVGGIVLALCGALGYTLATQLK